MALRALRDGAGSGVVKTLLASLLVLAVAGLVFMDVGSLFGGPSGPGGTNPVLARVAGQNITARDVAREMAPALQRLNMPAEQAGALGLPGMVLEGMVNTRAAAAAAARLGFLPDDAAVAGAIADALRAQGVAEADLPAALARSLREQGTDEAAFTARVRADMAAQALAQALAAPQVSTPPDTLVRAVYAHEAEARDIALVPFAYADAPDPGAAPEAALAALYAARREADFAVPERRALRLGEIVVGDGADVEALIAGADALDAALLRGASLAEAAADLPVRVTEVAGVEAAGGGAALAEALGPDGAQEVAGVAFALEPGMPSAVLELPGPRFVAVEVVAVEPRSHRPFEDVRDDLAAQWARDARRAATREAAAAALERLEAGSADMGAVAGAPGAGARKEVPGLTRGAPALPMPLVPEALPPIFAAPVGGHALVDIPGGVAVVRVVDARLPDVDAAPPEALEAVRARLTAQIARETLEMYLAHARAAAGAVVYDDRLAAAFGGPAGRARN